MPETGASKGALETMSPRRDRKSETTTREPAAVVGVRRALRAEAPGDHIRSPAHVSFETSSLTLGTPMPVTMS
jgi:hypothetical protein